MVNNANDLAQLATYAEVTGDVTIQTGAGVSELALPNLSKVGGEFKVIQTSIEHVELSALTSVGLGVRFESNALLKSFDLECLKTGGVTAWENGLIVAIDLPALEVGAVSVIYEPLQSITAPKLTGGFILVGDPASPMLLTALAGPNVLAGPVIVNLVPSLATVSFPVLKNGGDVRFESTGLTALDLPSLTSADLRVTGNAELTQITAPLLSTGNVEIDSNPKLVAPQFGALTSVTNLRISGCVQPASMSFPFLTQADDISIVCAGPKLSLPGVTALSNFAVGGPSLECLAAPALQSVSQYFVVNNNPKLPQCQVDGIYAQLQPPLPLSDTSGNAGTGPCLCPP